MTICKYIFIFTHLKYFSRKKEPGMTYAVNDTFDDVRGGYNFHNKAVTNKSKNPQVRTKIQVFNKLSAQWVSINTFILRNYLNHISFICIEYQYEFYKRT